MKTYNLVKKIIQIEEKLKLNEIKMNNLYKTINSSKLKSVKEEYIGMYDKIFNEQIKLIQKHEFYTEKLKNIDLITEMYL